MTNQAQSSRHWGEIDGVSIDFPMVVQEMNSATLTWSVPLDAAAAVLPGDAFEPADMGGSAMLILALVDYLQNPWRLPRGQLRAARAAEEPPRGGRRVPVADAG